MSEVSSYKGAWIGTVCLVILVFQNSIFFLATHEGRVPDKDGHLYYAPTMVVLIELIKGAISFAILFYTQYRLVNRGDSSNEYSLLATSTKLESQDDVESDDGGDVVLSGPGGIRSTFATISDLLFVKAAWKLCIPATLYVIQTNLAVIGAQNLDSTSFIVASQLKFAATALCTSVMLHRVIGLKRWLSLGVLAFGVLLVQLAGQSSTMKATPAASERSPVIGLTSIVAACFISGFASIYLERILKDASNNLWATNIQLGVFSLLPAALPCFVDAWVNGFYHPFAYFGFWAWITVAANVSGGLVVALIMKYADNIKKSLAISASIVLTFVITVAVGKAEAAAMAIAGSALVIVSIVAYNMYPAPVQNQDPPIEQQLDSIQEEPLLTQVAVSNQTK